jgi:hypothetical protein
VATTPGVIEIRIDVRPFVAAMEAFAEAVRQTARALEALPYLEGLQKLATASDMRTAFRRGEVLCAGVHDALPPGGCHFCGAAL